MRAAAERRLAEGAARAAVVALGLPIDIDPHQALLDEVHRAAGAVAWLALQVADLQREDVVWGKTKEVSSEKPSIEHAAGVNVWVRLYGEWSDRLVKVSKAAIDAGVSERLVRLEEQKAEMIAEMIANVFDDPEGGLSDEQRQVMRVVAARHLRALPVVTE